MSDDQNKMLYVDGGKTAFRCEGCGANVFHELPPKEDLPPGEIRYECNGCGMRYIGEK